MGLLLPVSMREMTAASRPIERSDASMTYHFLSTWPGLAKYELLPVMMCDYPSCKDITADGGFVRVNAILP